MMDFTGFWQIIGNRRFKDKVPQPPNPVPPLSYPDAASEDIFQVLKYKDILLHHPYNNIDPILELIEKAADDPNVMAIKMTIYRLAKDSRITKCLLMAAEKGKHVSVLFEVKARFDEENNMREAKKLQKAGCFVIYGVSNFKTHTKLLLIVKKDDRQITKMTIYRLAKDSRITKCLLMAAEKGKHVSVLFEVKARFDEENNMREAKKLQKAGCFVIYGVSNFKTHTKLLLIVKKDDRQIT